MHSLIRSMLTGSPKLGKASGLDCQGSPPRIRQSCTIDRGWQLQLNSRFQPPVFSFPLPKEYIPKHVPYLNIKWWLEDRKATCCQEFCYQGNVPTPSGPHHHSSAPLQMKGDNIQPQGMKSQSFAHFSPEGKFTLQRNAKLRNWVWKCLVQIAGLCSVCLNMTLNTSQHCTLVANQPQTGLYEQETANRSRADIIPLYLFEIPYEISGTSLTDHKRTANRQERVQQRTANMAGERTRENTERPKKLGLLYPGEEKADEGI